MAHQYMPKIFHALQKTPPALPLTYLMYGSLALDMQFQIAVTRANL